MPPLSHFIQASSVVLVLLAPLPGAQPQDNPKASAPTREATSPSTMGSPLDAMTLPATKRDMESVTSAVARLEASLDEINGGSWLRDWTPAGAALLAGLVAIVSMIVTTRTNTKVVRETLAEKSREEEREAIRRQIDEFYGPFIQLRSSSRALYHNAFIPRRTPEQREKFSDADGNFRTLLALMKGHEFEQTDSMLLALIIDIGQRTADLIFDKVGLVDDPDLQQTLARATTHFRLIQRAFTDAAPFADSGSEFESFTFPADLDNRIQEKLNSLNTRLSFLSTAATQPK